MSCLLLRRLPSVLLMCLLVSACTPAHVKSVQARPPAPAPALRAVMPYFDQSWAMRKLWEDGLAEVATRDAERVVYKKKRTFSYPQITVKEEVNQQFNVKTDDYKRYDLFPVMKINQFCSIPAEQYAYHYLTSLFFRCDQSVSLFKMSLSSQEWCGGTFKSIIDDGMNSKMRFHSY